MTQIRKARADEASKISQIGIRSKAFWGYSSDQMQVFEPELTLQPEAIEPHSTQVHQDALPARRQYQSGLWSQALEELPKPHSLLPAAALALQVLWE